MCRLLYCGRPLLAVVAMLVYAALLTTYGCTNATTDPAAYDAPLVDVPPGFPPQTFPSDNVPTASRVALGRLLFHSVELSRTRTISCASCHLASFAFADTAARSIGVDGRVGKRNAPSLANVGYLPALLREGGVPTLEMQVLVPVQEHDEFDMNMLEVVERLRLIDTFRILSKSAYGRELDAWVVTRAIASFERTLVSGRSRADVNSLNASERRGKDLFNGAAGCAGCHGGFLYSNHTFANNGALPEYQDAGRARLTNNSSDSAVFRVPSLRNVGITAPYMHNGSIPTLEAVVAVYGRGGYPHRNKDQRISLIQLTNTEQADLVAFLRSLTDEAFTHKSRQ